VQILENHYQRLVDRFTQQNPLDRLQRTPPFHLPVHLGERVGLFLDSQQPEQVRQRVAERWFERGKLGAHLPAPR
jgi:hypothetical protein